jgi:CysZ protein
MLAPLQGFLLPFRALPMLFRPGIRSFVVIPLLLNIAVFALLAWAAISYFDVFMAEYLPEDTWLSFIRPVLWVIFALAYALAMFYGFTILANLIASPFNGILAARVEENLTGTQPEGANLSVAASIVPAITGELSKLAYFLKWAIPILILFLVASFIPGLNLLVTILWVAFGFWFLALEYADYPMGNYDMPPKEQRTLLRRRRFKSLGFGAGVSAMMLVLGFVAMPAAVVSATQFWVDDLKARRQPPAAR